MWIIVKAELGARQRTPTMKNNSTSPRGSMELTTEQSSERLELTFPFKRYAISKTCYTNRIIPH